jgi:hypothetical protein
VVVKSEVSVLIPMRFSLLIFYLAGILSVESFSQNEKNYRKADSIARLYPHHSLKNLHELTFKLATPLSTDEEKFRAVYRWVCENIDNDYTLYLKNKNKREKLKDPKQLEEWNSTFSQEVFQTLITKQRTVCTGYAYLIKQMTSYIGLPCEIINGYGRTVESNIGGEGVVNHSWNAVQLNGQWHLCDATWSAGAVETSERTFVKSFDEAYFLARPELFVNKHYPLDTAWMLIAQKPSLRDFLNGPIVYSAALAFGLEPVKPQTLNVVIEKRKATSFQFRKHGTKPIDKVEFLIKGSRALPKTLPTYLNEEGLLCFDFSLPSKGKYTIHILLNGSYAFTYVVDMK